MTPVEVELLSRQGNYTVLRLPGRAFPGVHIAGDSFSILVAELRELAAESEGVPEAREHAQDLAEELEGILGAYETAMAEHGIRPAYIPAQPARTTADGAARDRRSRPRHRDRHGQPEPALRIRLATLFDTLTHPRLGG
ncbi:hypothetical protein [Amycolatopsis sp. NPDC051372]|uniref:DUF6959 family protein n=1 Tax=Amycolatopsis sp. NPDC051372 TaxID=3155669 RepID=UPI0034427816